MAIHKLITNPGIYFVTFTCHNWMPLIGMIDAYSVVYTWFDFLSTKNHFINAYVTMPNHLHLILYYSGGRQSLNTIIGNGKRFMAYEFVNRMESLGYISILEQLGKAVLPKEKLRGKKHEIWKRSFDVKECRTEKFILQKLHYIHNNPCSGRWELAASPELYPHSSALFYYCCRQGAYPVRDYLDFLTFDED